MPIITPKTEDKKTRKQEVGGRISTGIPEYDLLLGGGFFPRTTNLISGCSGAGKTLFCLTCLYDGAKRSGKRGVYITLEEDTRQIMQHCKAIGMDLKSCEDRLSLLDVPALRRFYSNREELVDDSSLLDVDNMIGLIRKNCRNTDLVVIDSIVPLSLRCQGENEFRAAFFRLNQELKSLGATSIITTEISSHSNESRVEDFLADSVTTLMLGGPDGSGSILDRRFSERFMRVHKHRGSDHVKSFVEYRITSGGIKVFSAFRGP